MTTSQHVTLHLRFTQGHGWFVIERNPSVTFASTGTNERVVAGPFTSQADADYERHLIADVFDLDAAVAS